MATFQEQLNKIARSAPPPHAPSPQIETPACRRCKATNRILDENGICASCRATLSRGYTISRMIGRAANGAEGDGGIRFHARLLKPNGYPTESALCGARPGPHSAGWSDAQGAAVTCPRCLKRLNRLQAASPVLLSETPYETSKP